MLAVTWFEDLHYMYLLDLTLSVTLTLLKRLDT